MSTAIGIVLMLAGLIGMLIGLLRIKHDEWLGFCWALGGLVVFFAGFLVPT